MAERIIRDSPQFPDCSEGKDFIKLMEVKECSLYIHIPFCVQKCLYCDFHSAPADEGIQKGYIGLLCREIKAWGRILRASRRIKTIFIGGGTPSVLATSLLMQLGGAVRNSFDCSEVAEYTIEANPGTVTLQHAHAFREMGADRVSLGLQSAQDAELKALGRIHDYAGFLESYDLLRQEGFHNINIDLMAAIPGQTRESYADTLHRVTALAPEHISSYSLIIEPGTRFYEMDQAGMLALPDEDADREMYEDTERILSAQGYQRYEISNYAKAGKECRHNIVYWTGGDYLGVGENASSYLDGYRFKVPEVRQDYQAYVKMLEQELAPPWEWKNPGTGLHQLIKSSIREQMEEFMFLGLRMMRGISVTGFRKRFGEDIHEVYGAVIDRHIKNGLISLSRDGERLALTRRGIDISNYVLSDFILE